MSAHWRPLKLSLLSSSVSLPFILLGVVVGVVDDDDDDDDDGRGASDDVELKEYTPPFPDMMDVLVAGSTTLAGAPDGDPKDSGRTLLNSLKPTMG